MQAMLEQGCDAVTAKNAFYIADEKGMLTKDRDDLNEEQKTFARDARQGMSLEVRFIAKHAYGPFFLEIWHLNFLAAVMDARLFNFHGAVGKSLWRQLYD